jgi:hypothetical protein
MRNAFVHNWRNPSYLEKAIPGIHDHITFLPFTWQRHNEVLRQAEDVV